MIQRLYTYCLVLVLGSLTSFGQDHSLRVMHYNILNYQNNTGQCNTTTNNPGEKEGHLKRIFDYVKPDVLTLNEVGAKASNRLFILQNSLDPNLYATAAYTNNGTSNLTNAFFYRKDKLILHSQDTIGHAPDGFRFTRVVDYYRMYLNDKARLSMGDTAFIGVFVVHLKAGSTSSDKFHRTKMVEGIMHYMASKNYNEPKLIAGDFNTKTSTEEAYQLLIKSSSAYRFVDPVNQAGSWTNNEKYAAHHTQSTRTTDTRGGCAAGGGLDDRFDFILMDTTFFKINAKFQYQSESYKALGQDGNHFNQAITDGTNTSVPVDVLKSLYEVSDHLPIVLDIDVEGYTLGVEELRPNSFWYTSTEQLVFQLNTPQQQCTLLDFSGRIVASGESANGKWVVPIDKLSSGLYFMRSSSAGQLKLQKVRIK